VSKSRVIAITLLYSTHLTHWCLTDALNYIHSQATRHLDIKPGNILVKKGPYRFGHRVYIADFGISKSFSSLDHSQTDDPIPRTPKYCAPEVWERGMYGRAADIFSLGCVFTEMLTPLAGKDLDEFADFRSLGGERKGAFRESLSQVTVWMRGIQLILDREKYQAPWLQGNLVDAILDMLEDSFPKIYGLNATSVLFAGRLERHFVKSLLR
jgi:serine/threonine protein kinase